jgi:hypothetical protein
MNLQHTVLDKLVPQGSSFLIAAGVHHCRKCQVKCEALKPCPKCGDKDSLNDVRFPQGMRTVQRDGELYFDGSRVLPSGFITTCFGWKIPWRDEKNGETGWVLVQWAYLNR